MWYKIRIYLNPSLHEISLHSMWYKTALIKSMHTKLLFICGSYIKSSHLNWSTLCSHSFILPHSFNLIPYFIDVLCRVDHSALKHTRRAFPALTSTQTEIQSSSACWSYLTHNSKSRLVLRSRVNQRANDRRPYRHTPTTCQPITALRLMHI